MIIEKRKREKERERRKEKTEKKRKKIFFAVVSGIKIRLHSEPSSASERDVRTARAELFSRYATQNHGADPDQQY